MTEIKAGDHVRHSHRGGGVVKNVAINPLTKKASKVEVDFKHGIALQPIWCWPDDLTVIQRPPVPAQSGPVLKLIAQPHAPSVA